MPSRAIDYSAKTNTAGSARLAWVEAQASLTTLQHVLAHSTPCSMTSDAFAKALCRAVTASLASQLHHWRPVRASVQNLTRGPWQ